jgi:glycosyltransferase involved in cell wall biosynthesis
MSARGIRVAIDWHMIGQPGVALTDVGRYQRTLTDALVATAQTDDDLWALIAWPGAVDHIGPGIAHAGIGHHHRAWHQKDARDMIDRLGCDVVVASSDSALQTTVPVIEVVHDALAVTHPEWVARGGRIAHPAALSRVMDATSLVIAVSEIARVDVQSVWGIPDERIVVIPPAIDEFIIDVEAARARIAASFGLNRYSVALGVPGPRANFDHLAQAVARIDGSRAVVVSPEAPPPDRRARDDAHEVRFLGPLTDAVRRDLIAGADIAAQVSLHDGCGMSVLEAMACGAPVIVSDRGALPELVGTAALIVPPTVNGIAQGLRAGREQRTADQLRASGRARAAEYSYARMGAAAWQVLRGRTGPRVAFDQTAGAGV